MQNKSKKKIKKTKKQEIKYEKDYPKDDDLINRRVATHGYPEVSKERLKENRQYWGNRNDLDQTTISLDWNRAVYTSEIGGFSYDGPKVYFNDAYVYTHQMSLDLEGRLKIDDHNRYASLTQYNREKFNYTNVLVDVVPFDSNKNIWFKNEGFQSDYIGKARLFRSGNPENSNDVNNEKVLIIPEIDNKDLKEGKKKHSSDEIHKLIAGKEGQFGCIIS